MLSGKAVPTVFHSIHISCPSGSHGHFLSIHQTPLYFPFSSPDSPTALYLHLFSSCLTFLAHLLTRIMFSICQLTITNQEQPKICNIIQFACCSLSLLTSPVSTFCYCSDLMVEVVRYIFRPHTSHFTPDSSVTPTCILCLSEPASPVCHIHVPVGFMSYLSSAPFQTSHTIACSPIFEKSLSLKCFD